MAELFTPKYAWLWAVGLMVALFFPVRQLIWVLSVRRVERKQGAPTDAEQRAFLRRRAGLTAALLSFLFSVLYTAHLFQR